MLRRIPSKRGASAAAEVGDRNQPLSHLAAFDWKRLQIQLVVRFA
jgi:hypothetical protein